MRLSDYQWSGNPRGLHVASAFQTPMEYDRYTRISAGWVKLVAAGTEYVDDAMWFLANGITPIVRLYLGRYGAGPYTPQLRALVEAFIRAGVKWFEFYNEPNIDVEWPEGVDPTWEDTGGIIRPLIDNWLEFAEHVASWGAYPGFIALTESNAPRYASIRWGDAFLNYLASAHYDRFARLINSGLWFATHPYLLNHFYQQAGSPLIARQPADQRAREPGWHFEYPYDPISQAADPGRTVYGGTALTPYGDPNGLIAMGRFWNERCASIWGSQAIPVVGTEGGIWPFRGQAFWQPDNRYPPYTETSQAEATVAMFDWIAQQAPYWFFGLTLWKEDDYYVVTPAPAVERLAANPPILKSVPPIDVMGSGPVPTPVPIMRGPGPIRGQADFHMIVLAPGTGPEWFFNTAQAYWNRFRPIVTTMPELIDLIPNTSSLAVTVISPPEMIDLMRAAIADQYPNVYFDLIETTTFDEVRTIFEQRTRLGLRFG